MKQLLLSIALCFSLLACATAQVTTLKGGKSDQINIKIHEVDMLLQILPLLLTKDQINSKLLPIIEKNRDMLRKELAYEDDELAKLESILDDAMTAAYDKGAYPARKITDEVAAKTKQLSNRRNIVELQMVGSMTEVLDLTLNAGQKKALLGSFDTKFSYPNLKPEQVTDALKMNFFVERVFLDPITYEILKKLAK